MAGTLLLLLALLTIPGTVAAQQSVGVRLSLNLLSLTEQADPTGNNITVTATLLRGYPHRGYGRHPGAGDQPAHLALPPPRPHPRHAGHGLHHDPQQQQQQHYHRFRG